MPEAWGKNSPPPTQEKPSGDIGWLNVTRISVIDGSTLLSPLAGTVLTTVGGPGGFPPAGTCCDFFFYELDAWAKAGRPACLYRLAGDLNDDCKVDLADLAILARHWLMDCLMMPDDPACVAK